MNSIYNHVLKQNQKLEHDIQLFESGQDTSAGHQGQISAAMSAMQRSIDEYNNLSKQEMNEAKKELAKARLGKFRDELAEMRKRFEMSKVQQERIRSEQNRESLLARRPNRGQTSTPEYPYQNISREEYQRQEQAFADHTESQLDGFIAQAQSFLDNLSEQHGILKAAQKRVLDTANTLGLSQNTIRFIERRTEQDKWVFYGGLIITTLILWAMIHYWR